MAAAAEWISRSEARCNSCGQVGPPSVEHLIHLAIGRVPRSARPLVAPFAPIVGPSSSASIPESGTGEPPLRMPRLTI